MHSNGTFLFLLFFALVPLALSDFVFQSSTPLGNAGDQYGRMVAVRDDHALVGGPLHDVGQPNSGNVVFWRRNSTTGMWSAFDPVYPQATQAEARYGWAVALAFIDGSYIGAVGGYGFDGNKGRVEIFKFNDGSGAWEYLSTLTDSSGVAGDVFGVSVDLTSDAATGNTGYMIVGANLVDRVTPTALSNCGAVIFFEKSAGSDTWVQGTRAFGSTAGAGDELGYRVAIHGSRAVAGALYHDVAAGGNNNDGVAYAWERTGPGVWSETQVISNPAPASNDYFGYDVSLHDFLVITGYGVGPDTTGASFFYSLVGSTWTLEDQHGPDVDNVIYGSQASTSGSVAVVSSQGEASAYAYQRLSNGTWIETQKISPSGAASVIGIAMDVDTLLLGDNGISALSGQAHFYFDGDLTPTDDFDSNPLRCGDYDDVNQRYFYDDDTGCETTPTIADACYYSAGDLVTTNPATLRTDLSELKAADGTDYLYLAFDIADKYYNTRLVFADAAANQCEHADWEQVSATRDVSTPSSCFTTFVYRLPWSSAYASDSSKCGWERDDSGANVKLVLDFAVRADEDLSTMRNGTTITREASFSMPVEVQFPVQVTASPVGIQVFSPVRVLAAVTSQTVTINEASSTATLTLDLFTEVQKPFELHAIVESTDSLPTGITLLSDMAGGDDDGTIRQDDECDDTNADCANTWRWQYTTPSVSGGSNPCDFDGTYQVSFSIRCSEVSNTNCPIDSFTDSVEITLTVSTSDHCPTVIDSVDLNAALAVYDLPARADAQDDFVGDGTQDDGQTADLNDWQVAYFAAPVTSTQVAISRTEFNQVWIVRHQETVTAADDDIIVLLDADDTINVAPYNTVGEIDCTAIAGVSNADATPTAVSAATGCSPTNPAGGTFSFNFKHGEGGNSAAGSPSTPIFEFDIRTDSAGFAMDDDAIETMQVNAVIDVEYANAAKRITGSTSSNSQQSTVTSAFSMQTTTTTSSTSTSLLGVNATILYGAGALLTLAVLAAVVVVSRRRRSSLPSTKLQSSTELTTV